MRAAALWLCAVGIFVAWGNWELDRLFLEKVAISQSSAGGVVQLLDWVTRNGSKRNNRYYYLHPSLGPTPMQVLQSGGQCEDRSRLLAVLLHELDIPSTLLVLQACANCRPVHTVVVARIQGDRFVLDANRNAIMLWGAIPDSYDYGPQYFANARTINWERNRALHWAGRAIAATGVDPYMVSRPIVLEDPKRLLFVVVLSIAGVVLLICMFTWRHHEVA